jgi:LAO/AO transport system kinase
VAVKDQGVAELCEAVERHRVHLATTGEGKLRAVQRARAGFLAMLRERLLETALARLEAEMGELDEVAARIAAREADPYLLAEELTARLRRDGERR